MQDNKRLYDSNTYMEDLRAAAEHVVGLGNLDGKRVLVTGASGTIGSFIVDMLLVCTKASVVVCGRSVEKLRARFQGEYEAAEFDLLSSDMTAHLPDKQIDFIIHAAGNAYPSAFVDRADDTVKGNILGTKALLDYGRGHGCERFVYVSSGEVYSLDEEFRNSFYSDVRTMDFDDFYDKVCQEVFNRGPRSCYPVSKAAAEAMCLERFADAADEKAATGMISGNAAHEMEVFVARPCHTFGPGITGADDRAHVQFAKKAIARETIVLNSAGTQLRSYNYVADTASGIVSLLVWEAGNADDISNLRVFDICSRDNEVTIRGLADIIAAKAGVSVVVKEADDRGKKLLSPISKQVLDSSHLESIGWGKAYDLEKGVAHYIDVLLGK